MTYGVFKAPILDSVYCYSLQDGCSLPLPLGRDMSVGFIGPEGEDLEFSITGSLALLIRQPKAMCVIK